MPRYAVVTTVSSEKTRNEIEATLARYGATAFVYGWEGQRAIIQFRAHDRHIRFMLPLPDKTSLEFIQTPTGKSRSLPQVEAAISQAVRQRWRALLLIIKAKLEAIDSGIVTFEDEFLSHTVLPDGRTAGEWLKPQIAIAYDRSDMPKMLPGPTGERK